MGFLDDLFEKSDYLNKNKSSGERRNEAKPAAPVPAAAPPVIEQEPAPVKAVNIPEAAPVRPATGNDPDLPVPFGYKCNWLCVKADSSLEVIEKLGLKNAEPSNWDKGIEMAYNGYRFVSPVLDGYILVVNFGMDILTLAPDLLDEKARLFPELQFFVTQRVSEYHAWAKYVNGEMIRGYGWCGCDGTVFLNVGELTGEEKRLGFTNLLPNENVDWKDYDTPDEEYVMELAAAWGIDPSFSTKEYPKSLGYICK